MFESLLPTAASTRRRRLRTTMIGVSVVAHGVVAVGLIVLGMWKIEKLQTERTTLSVGLAPPAGDSGGGGRPAQARPEAAKRPEKVVVKDLTQPDPAPDKEPPEVATEVAVEARGDGVAGDADGPPGNGMGGDGQGFGAPTVGHGCKEPPCGTGDLPAPELPQTEVAPPEPVTIPPTAAKRISGEDQITPPPAAKAEMLRAGKRQTIGSVRLCIGADGKVDSQKVIKSTGYPAYDDKLLRTMRTWRYRPHTVNGEPTPACFAVQLLYRITD